MNYSPFPCSDVLWKRRRDCIQWFRKPLFHIQTSRTADLIRLHQSGADRDEDVRERLTDGWEAWDSDWPVIAVSRTLGAVFFIPHQYSAHILLNTANGASDDWQDWVCRHTELNYPQNEATSPEASSPTRSLHLLHFICVLSSIRFASPFPVLKIYDILWFDNWIAFKTLIMRM